MIDLTAFAADYLKMLKRTWKMVLVLGIIGALVSRPVGEYDISAKIYGLRYIYH